MNEEMREREGIVDEEASGGWKVNIQGLAGRVADDKTKEHLLHKTGGIDFLILILYVLSNCKNETRFQLEDKKVVWFGWVCVKYRDMVMVIPWFGMVWYGNAMVWASWSLEGWQKRCGGGWLAASLSCPLTFTFFTFLFLLFFFICDFFQPVIGLPIGNVRVEWPAAPSVTSWKPCPPPPWPRTTLPQGA